MLTNHEKLVLKEIPFLNVWWPAHYVTQVFTRGVRANTWATLIRKGYIEGRGAIGPSHAWLSYVKKLREPDAFEVCPCCGQVMPAKFQPK